MIVHGFQLVLANQILAVYVNVMVMLNDVVLILFDMHKQIIHQVVFVKNVNIIQLVRDVNFVRIFFIKIIPYRLQIRMFVNVSYTMKKTIESK